jgi:drug/metabolite transporter (DMT)-like permease
MSPRLEGLLLVGCMLVISFFLQIQIKIFAMEIHALLPKSGAIDWSKLASHGLRTLLSWRFLLIGILAATAFSLWTLALMRLELSVALPMASIALIVNALGGGVLLGEAISLTRALGVLVVALGIALVLKT